MNAGVQGLFDRSNVRFSRSRKTSLKGSPLIAQAPSFYLKIKERKQISVWVRMLSLRAILC